MYFKMEGVVIIFVLLTSVLILRLLLKPLREVKDLLSTVPYKYSQVKLLQLPGLSPE